MVSAGKPRGNRPRLAGVLLGGTKLRELGIRPKYIRFGDFTARGYTLVDVEAAFRRYVPNADALLQPPKPE